METETTFKIGDRVKVDFTHTRELPEWLVKIQGKKGIIRNFTANNTMAVVYLPKKDDIAIGIEHLKLYLKKLKSEKTTYWVNIYDDNVSSGYELRVGCNLYKTKEEAYVKRGGTLVKTIKIKL